MSVVEFEIWALRDPAGGATSPGWDIDLTGFHVEASDGSIGKIDKATYDNGGGSYLVVDTGPWIFGTKVMLPAGVIDRIDPEERRVYVHRTRDQIKNAPEYDDSLEHDANYRNELGSYYGSPGGPGYQERGSGHS